MIAVDTSALMAIVLGESDAAGCIDCLETGRDLIISAATVAESLIVARRRRVGAEMTRLIGGLGFQVLPVTAGSAQGVADAYATWGKGVHPAGLNFGDCFSYEVAKAHDCPLLYVGNDFDRTDIQSAMT